MKPQKVVKRKKDRLQTIELLKEAAIDIISRYGFDKATTKLISQKAGVAEALILRYFGSKNGLLLALTQDFVRESHARELDYPPQENLEEELSCYVSFAYSKTLVSKKITKVILVRALTDEKFLRDLKKEPQEINPQLVTRFNKLSSEKKIPKGVTLENIDRDLSIQIVGTFLLGPMYELDAKTCEERLGHWARIYVRDLFQKSA